MKGHEYTQILIFKGTCDICGKWNTEVCSLCSGNVCKECHDKPESMDSVANRVLKSIPRGES